jgi:hypothetical protein
VIELNALILESGLAKNDQLTVVQESSYRSQLLLTGTLGVQTGSATLTQPNAPATSTSRSGAIDMTLMLHCSSKLQIGLFLTMWFLK